VVDTGGAVVSNYNLGANLLAGLAVLTVIAVGLAVVITRRQRA